MTSDPCSQVGASRERTTNGQTSSANELEDTSAISRGSASRIAKLYREDILKLEALLDRDLSVWLE